MRRTLLKKVLHEDMTTLWPWTKESPHTRVTSEKSWLLLSSLKESLKDESNLSHLRVITSDVELIMQTEIFQFINKSWLAMAL